MFTSGNTPAGLGTFRGKHCAFYTFLPSPQYWLTSANQKRADISNRAFSLSDEDSFAFIEVLQSHPWIRTPLGDYQKRKTIHECYICITRKMDYGTAGELADELSTERSAQLARAASLNCVCGDCIAEQWEMSWRGTLRLETCASFQRR